MTRFGRKGRFAGFRWTWGWRVLTEQGLDQYLDNGLLSVQALLLSSEEVRIQLELSNQPTSKWSVYFESVSGVLVDSVTDSLSGPWQVSDIGTWSDSQVDQSEVWYTMFAGGVDLSVRAEKVSVVRTDTF